MKLKLQKLQSKNKQIQKAKVKYSKNKNDIKKVLYYQNLFYISKII